MPWNERKLGDICDNWDSKRIPITKKDRIEGEIPYYGASGIVDYVNEYIFDEDLLLVSEDGANLLARTYPIAFSVSGKSWVNNHAHALKFEEPSTQKFVEYFLNSISLVDFVSGMAQPKLNQRSLSSIPIPLPPLPERKRIVAILDQAFAEIEQARAFAEKNLNNISELYLSKKEQIFHNLNDKSRMASLPSICENIFAGGDAPQKGAFTKSKTEEFQIPIYANAVRDNGLYGFTDFSRVENPSITIAARGSGTGHIELRRGPFLPIVRLIVLTPSVDIVSLDYLKHALQNLDILRSGSAIPQLTVPMIKGYSIPLPDLDSQNNVVKELNELDGLISTLAEVYEVKIRCLDELKKSILQQAFSGQLTSKEAA